MAAVAMVPSPPLTSTRARTFADDARLIVDAIASGSTACTSNASLDSQRLAGLLGGARLDVQDRGDALGHV